MSCSRGIITGETGAYHIDNPNNSRPIDVHRWSDHPEVKVLVEEIWEGYLPPEITGGGRTKPGPKPIKELMSWEYHTIVEEQKAELETKKVA